MTRAPAAVRGTAPGDSEAARRGQASSRWVREFGPIVRGVGRHLILRLIQNLWRYRELLVLLAWREVAARYKQSLLGPLWALLQPLSLMLVLTAVRQFVELPSDGVPYPLFSYAGALPWTLFTSTVAMATPSIVSNAAIVKKIYFPREIFPVSAALVTTFDFVMAFLVLLGIMTYYQHPITWMIVLALPLAMLQQAFAVGVTLLTCALGTFKRDILFAATFLLQVWMYLSPVIYPVSSVPKEWRSIYLLNPMAGIIASHRSVVLFGKFPELDIILPPIVGTTVLLIVGYTVFKRLEKYFADVV